MKMPLIAFMTMNLLLSAAHAGISDAESQAITTGIPRDCSLLIDQQKKAICVDFNKTLLECQTAGYRVGLELKACMVKKGKIKR